MIRNGQLTLDSGLDVRVTSLQQYETYAGLLEGYPTAQQNAEQLKRLERERKNAGERVVLLRPTERPLGREGERYPFGTPSALPAVTCIAQIRSTRPARDPKMGYSTLTIIWFQAEYAFPIEPDSLAKIKAIDWKSSAKDEDY